MMKVLVLLVCLLVCFWSTEAHVYESCPSGWMSFGTSCYMYHGPALNRIAAENVCRQFSGCSGGTGHLVSLDSAAKNNFINNYIRSLRGVNDATNVWLGGQRVQTTNSGFVWRWSDGAPISASTFNAFPEGTLPQIQGRNCMMFSERVVPEWMPVNCQQRTAPFICELKANIPQPPMCQSTTPVGNPWRIGPYWSGHWRALPIRYNKAGNVEQRDNGRP